MIYRLYEVMSLIQGLHYVNLPKLEKSFTEWNTTAHKIHAIYWPNGWNSTTLKYDLALVITKSPFIYNKHVASIKPELGYPHSNLLKSMNL